MSILPASVLHSLQALVTVAHDSIAEACDAHVVHQEDWRLASGIYDGLNTFITMLESVDSPDDVAFITSQLNATHRALTSLKSTNE